MSIKVGNTTEEDAFEDLKEHKDSCLDCIKRIFCFACI